MRQNLALLISTNISQLGLEPLMTGLDVNVLIEGWEIAGFRCRLCHEYSFV